MFFWDLCSDDRAEAFGSIQMIERFYSPLAGDIYVSNIRIFGEIHG